VTSQRRRQRGDPRWATGPVLLFARVWHPRYVGLSHVTVTLIGRRLRISPKSHLKTHMFPWTDCPGTGQPPECPPEFQSDPCRTAGRWNCFPIFRVQSTTHPPHVQNHPVEQQAVSTQCQLNVRHPPPSTAEASTKGRKAGFKPRHMALRCPASCPGEFGSYQGGND
jgi:hypothetical protein